MENLKDRIPYIMMGIGNIGVVFMVWHEGITPNLEAALFWVIACDIGAITLLVIERHGSIKCK
jgi:hypothetical protein